MYAGLTDSIWSDPNVQKQVNVYYYDGATEVFCTDEIVSVSITSQGNEESEYPTIGSTYAKLASVRFFCSGFNVSPHVGVGGKIRIEFAAGGEVLPVGIFYISESSISDGIQEIAAYDEMEGKLNAAYVPSSSVQTSGTAWTVLQDIQTQSGVSLGSTITSLQTSLSAIPMANIQDGTTYREAIGWCAALVGKNAAIGRTGLLEFQWFTDNGLTVDSRACDTKQYLPDDAVLGAGFWTNLYCSDGDGNWIGNNPYSWTSMNQDGPIIENPYMTTTILDSIKTNLQNFNYHRSNFTYSGDPRMDCLDLVGFQLYNGDNGVAMYVYKVPIISLTVTYDGGLSVQVGTVSFTRSKTAVNSNTALTSKVEKLTATTSEIKTAATDFTSNSYTSFDGSVLSGGSIGVFIKGGQCTVFGYLKPSASVTNFTQVLNAVKVPAPQHGANITPTVPSYASASDLPARVRVQGAGGLAIQGGTANREYNFSITYPVA